LDWQQFFMAKTDIEDSEWNPDDAPPSKSSKKRAMTALQVLGTRLVNLTPSQLEQIPIEDARLQDAVLQARKITQRGGLRRQLQYIGKLMRVIDSEPIETALAKLDGVHQA
jgi:ribosome-associated protein